jgi:hypothetical protein
LQIFKIKEPPNFAFEKYIKIFLKCQFEVFEKNIKEPASFLKELVKNHWFRVGYLTDSLIFGEPPVKGPYTQLLPTSPFLQKRKIHTVQVTTHSNRIPAHRPLTKCVLKELVHQNLKMMNRCIHGTTYCN